MTVYQFAASAGSVLSWSMVDQLIFSNVYTAGSLQFTQQGPDLVVSCQGVSVTLATTTIQNLSSSSFLFQDGSQLKIASAGGELLNG